ncbi:MAG: M24B family metallopeptidase, partial [Pseudomonadota bacterium]
MFQSFDATASPDQGPPRLDALRGEINGAGLDGFLVPRADWHQGEYVAPCDERLSWLTGFTGSAGFCAVLRDQAGVFVDGRYRVQVKAQVAPVFTPVDWPETSLGAWLKTALPDGGRVGFDPWLHSVKELKTLRETLQGTAITLTASDNLIDRIRLDQPTRPNAAAKVYPADLAGKSDSDKRAEIAERLREDSHKAAVLTLPDSIAWLLNIRGADIERIPIAQAFAILHDDGSVALFSDPEKFEGLALDPAVSVAPWDAFTPALAALTGPVRLDPASAPVAVAQALEEAEVAIAEADDPCILPKACKNPAEIAATKAAHLRDGAAMCEFLAWLDEEARALSHDPGHSLTEIDAVQALEGFRRATNALEDISFDTISGAGPNGAIVHYRVTRDTNRALQPGELLLVDSGGQYVDGTTDITRTIAIGPPSQMHRTCFTQVLKGMIGLSTLRWPVGRSGRDLDVIARAALWRAGRDYDHGTGHGVGVFLSVHEGPQRIARI